MSSHGSTKVEIHKFPKWKKNSEFIIYKNATHLAYSFGFSHFKTPQHKTNPVLFEVVLRKTRETKLKIVVGDISQISKFPNLN